MKKFIKSWKFPVVLFTPGVTYVALLWFFSKDITFEVWYDRVIIWVFLPTLILVAARFETPRQTREREERARQAEAEELAQLPPEAQQLQLQAKQKMKEFEYSIAMFLITCLISGAVIYYVNWVL